MASRPTKSKGLSHWLFEGLRIHGTGSSNFKMAMRTVNVTLRGCELYDAGALPALEQL